MGRMSCLRQVCTCRPPSGPALIAKRHHRSTNRLEYLVYSRRSNSQMPNASSWKSVPMLEEAFEADMEPAAANPSDEQGHGGGLKWWFLRSTGDGPIYHGEHVKVSCPSLMCSLCSLCRPVAGSALLVPQAFSHPDR